MLKNLVCLLSLFAIAPGLSAQQRIDVVSDAVYVSRLDSGKIHQIVPEGHAKEIRGLVPQSLDFRFKPRPRIRFGMIWISNGVKLYCMPLDAKPDEAWETAKLPEGLIQFADFEILSNEDAIICGAAWDSPRLDLHFVFSHKTGTIKRTIEELGKIPLPSHGSKGIFAAAKESEGYLCRFDPYILIVGCSSGRVTILDSDGKNAKAFQVVPEEDFPEDPEASVNSGHAIPWVGPLDGGAALVCCRRIPETGDGSPKRGYSFQLISSERAVATSPKKEYSFRTLDLETGKVAHEGAHYRGFAADCDRALLEMGGELLDPSDMLPPDAISN